MSLMQLLTRQSQYQEVKLQVFRQKDSNGNEGYMSSINVEQECKFTINNALIIRTKMKPRHCLHMYYIILTSRLHYNL